MQDRRDEFLVKVYDQMFSDINRHIIVVWQSISVVVGAFAVFGLAEKNVVPIDVAVSIMFLLCAWLFAHLLDSSYWYNRNLAIIANIERIFLVKEDLRNVHYYFGKHRENNKMITHLRIQFALGAGIVLIVLYYHIVKRMVVEIGKGVCAMDYASISPYIVMLFAVWYIYSLNRRCDAKLKEFLENSPGILVDTDGVGYGVGHGMNG